MNQVRPHDKLLLDTPPLTVQKELAVALDSLDKALVLQQLHYYLRRAKKANNEYVFREGRWWVYNSYPQWKEDHFPFWSEAKIGRIFRDLEADGLVISKQLGAYQYDRRKWYTINYDALDALLEPQKCTVDDSKMTRWTVADCNDGSCQSAIVMSKTSSKTSTKQSAPVDEPAPERDFLGDIHKKHQEELDKNADRKKGYRDATEEEYRVCERVANLWMGGELQHFAHDIERAIAGANYILELHGDDLRKAIRTIDEYHAAQDGEGPTITSPHSLRNVLPGFMAQRQQSEGPIRIER